MRLASSMVILLVLLCVAGQPGPLIATESSDSKIRECIADMNQRSAILSSQDWPTLKKRGELSLSKCKDKLGDEGLSHIYMQLAIANNEMNSPKDGLSSAQLCIDRDYRNAACHLQQVIALHALVRNEEARAALDVAMRLIGYNIEKISRDLRRPGSSVERELLENRLDENFAHLELAKRLDADIP